jgi:hypothetical protein
MCRCGRARERSFATRAAMCNGFAAFPITQAPKVPPGDCQGRKKMVIGQRGEHERGDHSCHAAHCFHSRSSRNHVSISPFPLMGMAPRWTQWKRLRIASCVARLIWILPGTPCDSSLLARLTASPHTS